MMTILRTSVLATVLFASVAHAQTDSRGSRGYGSQTPQALSADLGVVAYEIEGLKRQIVELESGQPTTNPTLRHHPERAAELAATARNSLERRQAEYDRIAQRLQSSQAFVATNDARTEKGDITENNARIVQMLNRIDGRFGAFLLPPRVIKLYTFFGKVDPDMKEFELKVKELLAEGKHRVVLNLYRALEDKVFEQVQKEMNEGRRHNNTLSATKDVLLDTLFVKELPASEELQKLRADVILSAFEISGKYSFLYPSDAKLTKISNLINHIFNAKLEKLGLTKAPYGWGRTVNEAKSQAISLLELHSASTSPINYLPRAGRSSGQDAIARMAQNIAALPLVKTQNALLDYSVATLLETHHSYDRSSTLQGVVKEFPRYHRRNELKALLEEGTTDAARTRFRNNLVKEMSAPVGIGKCERLFN